MGWFIIEYGGARYLFDPLMCWFKDQEPSPEDYQEVVERGMEAFDKVSALLSCGYCHNPHCPGAEAH